MILTILGLLVIALIIVVPIGLAAWIARRSVPEDGDYSGPLPRSALFLASSPMRLLMLLIVPGALVGVLAVMRIVTTIETRDWPTTDGTVYATSIEEHPGLITTYSLHIEYRFQVNDLPQTGFKLTWYDFRALDRADIEDQLAQYPKGTPVTVHYDPNGAYNSVLETRFGPGIPFIIGLTILLLIVSMVAMTLYLRALRLAQKHARHATLAGNPTWRDFY